MTTTSIPDIDLETPLHVVRIDLGRGEQEYLVGHTGNVYHKDRYIVGVFMDWSGSIKKNERVDLKFVPILGKMKQKTPAPTPPLTKPTTPPPKTKSPTPPPKKTKSPKKTKRPIPPPKKRINLVL